MRVNHNNRAPGYLQQLAYFTETRKEWWADSAGKGLRSELQNRTCRLLSEANNLNAPPPDSAPMITFSEPQGMSYVSLVAAAHVTSRVFLQ